VKTLSYFFCVWGVSMSNSRTATAQKITLQKIMGLYP